jgi:hypothetical protein
MSNQQKAEFLIGNLLFKVSRKVMVKFCQNPDLDQKVQSAKKPDLANRSRFRQS